MAGVFIACPGSTPIEGCDAPNKSIDLGRCQIAIPAIVCSDDLGQMKILNLAVVGAFAGGVAGALIGASTMFAVDVLMPSAANAAPTQPLGIDVCQLTVN